MKKIFLTGSTSYLGTKFIDLYSSSYDILGVSRSDPSHPLDLQDFEAVKNEFTNFRPDLVVHTAADLGRDSATSSDIAQTNPSITKNLVVLAKASGTPFIFTSTEAVYGGNPDGEYTETDVYKPRSSYGQSKVESEKIVRASGLPYLITRGHRYVGVSPRFNQSKQFPDTLKALITGQGVHLDSVKLFTPTLINHICDVFDHFISNDLNKQIILNLGVEKATTYYDFIIDVARALNLDTALIKPDGDEAGWPANSILSLNKLSELNYPTINYSQILDIIRADFQQA